MLATQLLPPVHPDMLYGVKQAAFYLNVSDSFLNKARLNGTGPDFIRLGSRNVKYRVADLNVWRDARRNAPIRHPKAADVQK